MIDVRDEYMKTLTAIPGTVRARIEQMISEDDPYLEPFDQDQSR